MTQTVRLPLIQSLKDHDIYTVSGYEQHVNSKCILAMIEVIHENTERANISCTNTDLFSYLVKSEWDKAKSLVYPDDKARRLAGEPWHTYERCKATAMSTVLLIPCHHEAINHWYLLARVKVQGGKHNVYIFDSMGMVFARNNMKKIKESLITINLMDETDKCIPLNLKRQTEQECGVRMMNYMLMFKEWVDRNKEAHHIIRQLTRATKSERKEKSDLAKASRKKISDLLKIQKDNALG